MIEPVTVGALSAVLVSVGNGLSGELSRWIAEEVGVRVRRTLRRDTPLPTGSRELRALARELHARTSEDPQANAEWAAFLRSLPADEPVLDPVGQVPSSTRWFTDRKAVLAWLSWEARRPALARPRVAQLDGPPGIGTSAAALHWCAGQGEARFPHGRIYVDLLALGGGSEGPRPSVVLRRVLEEMGVDQDGMPPTEEGRAALYQRLIRNKRVLVVIDHASSAAQTRALVPPRGTPSW